MTAVRRDDNCLVNTGPSDLLSLESALLNSRFSGVELGDGDPLADAGMSLNGQLTGLQGRKSLELQKKMSGFPVAPKPLLSFA